MREVKRNWKKIKCLISVKLIVRLVFFRKVFSDGKTLSCRCVLRRWKSFYFGRNRCIKSCQYFVSSTSKMHSNCLFIHSTWIPSFHPLASRSEAKTIDQIKKIQELCKIYHQSEYFNALFRLIFNNVSLHPQLE